MKCVHNQDTLHYITNNHQNGSEWVASFAKWCFTHFFEQNIDSSSNQVLHRSFTWALEAKLVHLQKDEQIELI